jgi:hypothetical protein
VGKGEETRLAVLDQAVDVARRVGLSGLTIGRLAEQTALSKSWAMFVASGGCGPSNSSATG